MLVKSNPVTERNAKWRGDYAEASRNWVRFYDDPDTLAKAIIGLWVRGCIDRYERNALDALIDADAVNAALQIREIQFAHRYH